MKKQVNLEYLVELVNSATGVNINENTRKRSVIDARYIYYKLAKKHTNQSMQQIADEVGILSHSTVYNGITKIKYIQHQKSFTYPNIYEKLDKTIIKEIEKINVLYKLDKLEREKQKIINGINVEFEVIKI